MRAAARHMKRQRSGSIVVTAWSRPSRLRACELWLSRGESGHRPGRPGRALELGPYDVRINAIAPGPVATNIGNGRMKTRKGRDVRQDIAMARVAELKEIKRLALLLASPDIESSSRGRDSDRRWNAGVNRPKRLA